MAYHRSPQDAAQDARVAYLSQQYRSSTGLTAAEERELGNAFLNRAQARDLQLSQPLASTQRHWADSQGSPVSLSQDTFSLSQSSVPPTQPLRGQVSLVPPPATPGLGGNPAAQPRQEGRPSRSFLAPDPSGAEDEEEDPVPGSKRLRPQLAVTDGPLVTRSLVSAFSAASGTVPPTQAEERAIRAVYDEHAFNRRLDLAAAGVSLRACSRGRIVADGGRQYLAGSTVNVGTIFMFPTSPDFAWDAPTAESTNWHSYEVVSITPPGPAHPTESFVLASCGLTFPLSATDVVFRRTDSHRITLSFLPRFALHPNDTTILRARRLRLESEAAALLDGPPPPRPSPARHAIPAHPPCLTRRRGSAGLVRCAVQELLQGL